MAAEVPTIALPQAGWSMRPWREEDVPQLARAANDERILQWMSDTWPSPYTESDARWWIETGQHQSGSAWALCLHEVEQALRLEEVTRVFAPIHAGNERSVRVAEKAGLRLESVQPRSAFKRGRVIDRVVYATYA